MTDAAGNIVAKYEYSPFGEVTAQSGAYADANPFRFSSEYADSETGLVYYNYRYYSPAIGRWLSRDPIAEMGGLNLYGFLDNDGINAWDALGLDGYAVSWPSQGPNTFCIGGLCKSGGLGGGLGDGLGRGGNSIINPELQNYLDSFNDERSPAEKRYDDYQNYYNQLKQTCDQYKGCLCSYNDCMKRMARMATAQDRVDNGRSQYFDNSPVMGIPPGVGPLRGSGGSIFTKLRGTQGWRDALGNIWKKDQLHKDHWDVSNRKGNKIKEVDFDGKQIWPNGPKNKNK